jgi:hypothetical protein
MGKEYGHYYCKGNAYYCEYHSVLNNRPESRVVPCADVVAGSYKDIVAEQTPVEETDYHPKDQRNGDEQDEEKQVREEEQPRPYLPVETSMRLRL